MGGSPVSLTGPDFTRGVELKDVPEGGALVGHAHGEAVMLTRRGAEVFAVANSCTHYGAPLSDGLVTADTVRCPWHHASFSLRTGEALRAPAFQAIACFEVERTGNRVVVRGKRETSVKPSKPSVSPESVVIIGGGAAAFAAGEMLRRRGYAGPVKLLSSDADGPYDRPNLSKDYLAGNAPEEWIPLRPPEFYGEKKLELQTRARVTAIDPAKQELTVEGLPKQKYGALLIATGAEPVWLPIPGAELRHVFVLRTLADTRRILKQLDPAKRVVLLGAGFIGLEVAAALRARKISVEIIAPEAVPLERVVGKEAGQFLRALHEKNGVRFHLGTTAKEITPSSVRLSNGEELEADLVIMAVGVKPSMSLAEAAGLRVDHGLVVNEFLETSHPGIWAAGDVACFPDARSGQPVRVEHWVVAQRMGQTAALNILGARRPFVDPAFFWSVQYDTTFSYVGHAEGWDEARVEGSLESRDAAIRYLRGGKTAALLTIGRDKESLAVELELEKAASLLLRQHG